MQRKTRNIYFDVLKIIASILVVYNHTGRNAFTLFLQYEPDRIKFWIYLFMAVLGRFPIPIFLGISGALLLPKQESLKEIWKNRISKMFFTLLVFSFISYMWDVIEGKIVFSWIEFVRGLYSSQWSYAYWYLYAYLGFLIILPFLRSLVQKMENRDYYYLFGIVIVLSGIVPIAEFLFYPELTLNKMLKIEWLTTDIFVYPLMGYFMQHKFRPANEKKFLVKMWIANIIGILISVGVTYYGMVIGIFTDDDNVQRFFESFVLVNSCTLFLTVKYLMTHYSIPIKLENVITYIGKYTFGIYLVHPILMWQILDHVNFCIFFVTEWHMDYMPAGILFTILVWSMSLVIAMLLKYIPGVKKLI